MGGRIARRLIDVGYEVHGHNRTRGRGAELEALGLIWAGTPRAVAESAETIITMVTDTEALDAVARGSDGLIAGLRPGAVFIDMSTVDPDFSRELAGEVAEHGGAMLDAPVSGSVSTLEAGRLSFMVGGDAETLEKVMPILLDIGARVVRVGSNGQGALMKVATNLQVAAQTVAFCESVLLAERGGIERKTAIEVLLASVLASPMLAYRAPFLLDPPAEAWFNVSMIRKDLRLASELAGRLGLVSPSTDAAAEVYRAADEMGLGLAEMAVAIDGIAELSKARRGEVSPGQPRSS